MAAAQTFEDHGDERCLAWYLFITGNIYTSSNLEPLTKFTSSSSRSTEFEDILPWSISQMI